MKMKIVLILGIVMVVVIGSITVLNSKKDAENNRLSSGGSMNDESNRRISDEISAETDEMIDTEPMMEIEPMMDNDPKQFTLTDVEGNSVTLKDFKGKKVYLKFWASWCSICLAGMDEMNQFSGEMNDFVVLTVVSPNYNGEQSESDFVNWYEGLELENMITLLDLEGSVAQAYGIRAYPTSVFIDADGNVFKTIPGHMDKESIVKIMDEMK